MAEPSRRGVLAAAVVGSVTLAGCKGLTALGPLPKPSADVVALGHAIAAEEGMVATYQAALDALGRGAGTGKAAGVPSVPLKVLREVLREHQAHLVQLRSRLVLPPRLATASPGPTSKPSALPAAADPDIADLVAAERTASARLASQLLTMPPALAQLMASIAASEASHVVLLRRAQAA